MELYVMLLWPIPLFIIIFLAVRLAISPLLNKKDENISESKDLGLVKLRDIDVLSNSELEEVIELYQNKDVKNKNYEQYQKYVRVLKELKEMGYFSEEQYSGKMNKLNNYFKVE